MSPIGRMLLGSLSDCLDDFNGFSPIYTQEYLDTGYAKVEVIEELINPKQITGELKQITRHIYTNLDLLDKGIDFLEGYIIRAKGLTLSPNEFGVSAVRKARHMGDVEGLIEALGFLLKNASNNMQVLSEKGYTTEQHKALKTIRKELSDDNVAQNKKIKERNERVVANYGLLNEFWDICTDIADAGKRIYKKTAPNKVAEFTIAELLRRIRQEQKRNKFTGTVTADGRLFANAKIEMVPVFEGRRRTTKSDAKGKFEIKSLTEGDYIVTVTAKGKQTITADATIVRGQTTTRNFDSKNR